MGGPVKGGRVYRKQVKTEKLMARPPFWACIISRLPLYRYLLLVLVVARPRRELELSQMGWG